uniref:COesterase domain-containing protein n=1 Tax=Panagrellus redivivus TaxID=6233 RepID=A0A7E4ZWB0_PANRE
MQAVSQQEELAVADDRLHRTFVRATDLVALQPHRGVVVVVILRFYSDVFFGLNGDGVPHTRAVDRLLPPPSYSNWTGMDAQIVIPADEVYPSGV